MNKLTNILIVVILVAAVCGVIIYKHNKKADSVSSEANSVANNAPQPINITNQESSKALPHLVDLGAGTCIPCKLMAPILEELKKEYAGTLQVDFYDVHKDPAIAEKYNVMIIPTQIFFDASGKELFRHKGFFSKEDILSKWKELSVDLSEPMSSLPAFERLAPAQVDNRPKDKICYMCDGDVDAKTLVTIQTDKGLVRLCGPHCYFIMYSCLTEDKTYFEKKVTVTDRTTGEPIPATKAVYLYGLDSQTGRPTIRAFTNKGTAEAERVASGGSIIRWQILQNKELATRCGFCDRVVYPEDAALVKADGLYTWGCCSHCAMGVAARTGKDVEVHEKDRLTGEMIIVKTFEGRVASLEPATSVAWFGQRNKPDGTWASTSCFHQGFFMNADNLKKWVEQNPYETGRLIPISQALADKMKLSPQQIQKACKIGECVPK